MFPAFARISKNFKSSAVLLRPLGCISHHKWSSSLNSSCKPDTHNSKLILHYTPISPPCRTILLIARELGLELNLKTVNLFAREHLKEDFIKMNPQHTVPCLEDGDFVIAESLAIMAYLIETNANGSKLYPQDPKKKAVVHQRVSFVNGTLFPRWTIGYTLMAILKLSGPREPNEVIVGLVGDSVNVVNEYLRENKWFAGDERTIADYSLFSTMTSLNATGIGLDEYVNILDWMKRCRTEMDGVDDLDTPGAKALAELYNNFKVHCRKNQVLT